MATKNPSFGLGFNDHLTASADHRDTSTNRDTLAKNSKKIKIYFPSVEVKGIEPSRRVSWTCHCTSSTPTLSPK